MKKKNMSIKTTFLLLFLIFFYFDFVARLHFTIIILYLIKLIDEEEYIYININEK